MLIVELAHLFLLEIKPGTGTVVLVNVIMNVPDGFDVGIVTEIIQDAFVRDEELGVKQIGILSSRPLETV